MFKTFYVQLYLLITVFLLFFTFVFSFFEYSSSINLQSENINQEFNQKLTDIFDELRCIKRNNLETKIVNYPELHYEDCCKKKKSFFTSLEKIFINKKEDKAFYDEEICEVEEEKECIMEKNNILTNTNTKTKAVKRFKNDFYARLYS